MMPSPIEHMARALDLAYTKRWVIAPMQRESSVAEHCYRVAVIADYLAQRVSAHRAIGFPLEESMGILVHALYHDWDEHREGDTPGPAKAIQYADYEGDPVKIIVKVADAIETGTWWVLWGNGRAWGDHPFNRAPRRDIDKVMHYAAKVPGLMEAATDVWQKISGRKMEDDYNGNEAQDPHIG